MIAYQAIIEPMFEDSWVVHIPHLDMGFYHSAEDGGRATLGAAIRSFIEVADGSKDFGLVLSVAGS